jgi:hypothetical protein
MKKLAKLALFFSCNFAILLLVSAGGRLVAMQVEWVRTLPQRPETLLSEIIAAVQWALSLAMYGSILFTLSCAARNRVFAPAAALCLIVLPLVFSFGICLTLEHWKNVPPASSDVPPLGGPGLILFNALRPTETAIVLLNGPAHPAGPKVTAVPDKPLVYIPENAETDGAAISLPPVPFRNDTPWFLKSLAIDLRLNAEQLQRRFDDGLFSFGVYIGALIFFLGSLGFILKLSAWPLANLFLGCLAFRGILAMEIFFNSPEIQEALDFFLKNRLPLPLAVPLIFCCFGVLIHLYSVLVYLAKRRDDDAI